MMAKVFFVLLISFLVEVKSEESNVIDDVDDYVYSCPRIISEFDSIRNMLHAQNEKTCRKVCPSGFDYLPEVDGCFKVIFQSLTWNRAGEVCRKVMPGVHLVAITSESKQQAIENYLEDEFTKTESSACLSAHWPAGGKSAWISGQTQNPNGCGNYFWKTLEAVETRFNYTNWLAGEPSCPNHGGEHCAHIVSGRNYTWNDASCHLRICALCEF